MKIEIKIKSGREWVAKAMHATQGKDSDRMSDETFRGLLRACHSPVEEYQIWIDAEVPERVHTHIVRHEEIGKYVSTSRPDLVKAGQGLAVPTGWRKLSLCIDAKRLIEICRQRLCQKAWWETRIFFEGVAKAVEAEEPAFRGLLAPVCVWYGFCPEAFGSRRGCGFVETQYAHDVRGVMRIYRP